MAVIGLLGATGSVGARAAQALGERGVGVLAAGRDPAALERIAADLDGLEGRAILDVEDADAVARVAARVDAVVNAAGPYARTGAAVLRATRAAGRSYVDCATEQAHLAAALREARDGGPPAVVGCGVLTGIGDLLAAVAADELEAVRDVHVAYLLERLRRTATPGLRASVAEHLGRATLAWDRGRLREEGVAHRRRLSWFPRPIGPRNTVAVPTGEPLTVPRHLPDVATVRGYLAVRSPTAELLQALDAAARRPGPRRLLRGRLTGGGGPPARGDERWACVAEAYASGGEVARAWAHGRDLAGCTAALLAAVTARLLEGRVAGSGVLVPADAIGPVGLLNELADVADVRWSVRAPGGRWTDAHHEPDRTD